ncbi:hypothetical protein Nepgr_026012 [Nepenthes gracilis]|uniref:Uncharacterized protein n=1 Tax=Nepenthes gracilis TaxID=150966 RepID=A0AAD3T829_NEPGR|nr:hypothetical protein Nepgr_026012 [Nepenthes gracilis]
MDRAAKIKYLSIKSWSFDFKMYRTAETKYLCIRSCLSVSFNSTVMNIVYNNSNILSTDRPIALEASSALLSSLHSLLCSPLLFNEDSETSMTTLVLLSHATTLSSSINEFPTSLQITMSSSETTEYNSFANLSNIMESAIDPAKLRSEFLRLLGTRRSPEGFYWWPVMS